MLNANRQVYTLYTRFQNCMSKIQLHVTKKARIRDSAYLKFLSYFFLHTFLKQSINFVLFLVLFKIDSAGSQCQAEEEKSSRSSIGNHENRDGGKWH